MNDIDDLQRQIDQLDTLVREQAIEVERLDGLIEELTNIVDVQKGWLEDLEARIEVREKLGEKLLLERVNQFVEDATWE